MDKIYADLLKDLVNEKIIALSFKSGALINAFHRSGYSHDDENYGFLQTDLAKIEKEIAMYQACRAALDIGTLKDENIISLDVHNYMPKKYRDSTISQDVHKYIMFLLAREVDTVEDEINEWELQIYPDHFEANYTYKIVNDGIRADQNKLIKHRKFINKCMNEFHRIEFKSIKNKNSEL